MKGAFGQPMPSAELASGTVVGFKPSQHVTPEPLFHGATISHLRGPPPAAHDPTIRRKTYLAERLRKTRVGRRRLSMAILRRRCVRWACRAPLTSRGVGEVAG